MVVVRAIELLRVGLHLRAPVVTAYGTERERDVVLVRLVASDGVEGWGECAALPQPTYSPEYVAGALDVLEHHLAPRLLGAPLDEHEASQRTSAVVGHPMAKAALEMAVLDARLRIADRSLADELGATVAAVEAGRTIGLHTDVGALRAEADEAVARRYRHLKLKVAPGWTVEPLAAVRAAHPGVTLRADANGGLTASTDLAALDDLDLVAIEQPLPVEHDADHARLAAQLRTAVALDEDVISLATGARLVAAGAADVVVAKPGRLGGLRIALALGRAVGGRAWVGGMYETGIGRAANLALAACTDAFAWPVDWSASDRYWDADVTAQHLLRADGTIAVPAGAGLGVRPDPAALAPLVRERRTVTA